jgi:hypothetical protein
LTSAVLDESLAKETSVIVAYHPTIFRGLQSLTLSNPLQASLLQCAAQGVSISSPHTALDSVWGGINDWLAEGLMRGKEDGEIRSLIGDKLSATSGESEGGEGRLVTLKEPIGIDVLEKRIKSHLKLSQSLFHSSSYPVLHSCSNSEPILDILSLIIYSPSRLPKPERITKFNACSLYRRLCWVRWLYASWPRCGCVSHGRDATRRVSLRTLRPSKLIFVTTARGFGYSSRRQTRHSL